MNLIPIKGMQMANTPYRTRRGSHPCVQYWDRAFQRGGYWLDWIVCQGGVSNEIDHVIEEFGLPELEASELVWRSFAAAILGDESSPCFAHWTHLNEAVAEQDMPHFVCWSMIGAGICYGQTRAEATRQFKRWLLQDDDNGRFEGGYRLLPNLTVIKE